MATNLHEILAVEVDRKKTAERITDETFETFTKREQHFSGHIKKFEAITETGETFNDDISHIVTTVKEKLSHFEKSVVSMIDVMITKESTNTQAKADIIIKEDGKEPITLATDVPVQALVQIENILDRLRQKVYNAMPTLDPKINWFPDEQRGVGYWKSAEVKKRKTSKVQDFVVVVPPTDHHRAEIRDVTKDVQIGNWIEQSFSGMISPAEKSEILARVEKLIEAVKKARSRANGIEAINTKIGTRLFKYIDEGI
jgi:hypothetical protein